MTKAELNEKRRTFQYPVTKASLGVDNVILKRSEEFKIPRDNTVTARGNHRNEIGDLGNVLSWKSPYQRGYYPLSLRRSVEGRFSSVTKGIERNMSRTYMMPGRM